MDAADWLYQNMSATHDRPATLEKSIAKPRRRLSEKIDAISARLRLDDFPSVFGKLHCSGTED